jgi:ATP/maltotriose-dependent transcriptional regulator MalT
VSDAIDGCRKLLEIAGDDRLARAYIENRVAGLMALRGEIEPARKLFDRVMAVLEDFGRRQNLGMVMQDVGVAELETGDLASAESLLRSSFEELSKHGADDYAATSAAFLARVLIKNGRYEEAERSVETAEKLGEGDPTLGIETDSVRAWLAAERGDADEAIRLMDLSLAEVAKTDLLSVHATIAIERSHLLKQLGHDAAATEAAASARKLCELKGATALLDRIAD